MFAENVVGYRDRNRHLSNPIAIETSCASDNGNVHWHCNILTIIYATENNSPSQFPFSHFASLLQFFWEVNPFKGLITISHLSFSAFYIYSLRILCLNSFSCFLPLYLCLPCSLCFLLCCSSLPSQHITEKSGVSGKPLDLYGNTPGTSRSLVPSSKLQDSNSIRLPPFWSQSYKIHKSSHHSAIHNESLTKS